MKIKRIGAAALVGVLTWGASTVTQQVGAAEDSATFAAYVDESQEVPRTGSEAWCWMIFEVGTESIDWSGRCFGLENVVAGHLHLAPPGENGAIVTNLLAPGGKLTGDVVDISGTITAATLTGPLAGQPLEALASAIAGARIYANFHSDDGVPPPNTGPGDLATGEIRGNLVAWD